MGGRCPRQAAAGDDQGGLRLIINFLLECVRPRLSHGDCLSRSPQFVCGGHLLLLEIEKQQPRNTGPRWRPRRSTVAPRMELDAEWRPRIVVSPRVSSSV